MRPEQREELKQAALAAKGWNWNATQGDQFGREEDGSFYDIGTVDADQYSQGGDGEDDYNGTVLRFIAKADPAAILSLIAQVEALTVPQGWKLVPEVPTRDQCLAGAKHTTPEVGDEITEPEAYFIGLGRAACTYAEMIGAAPTIPAIPGTKEGA